MADADLEAIAADFARRLELDGSLVEVVPTGDTWRIKELRSAGRRAGRILGTPIRTFATEREDGHTNVWVASVEPSPEDDARFRERAALLMREAFKQDVGLGADGEGVVEQ